MCIIIVSSFPPTSVNPKVGGGGAMDSTADSLTVDSSHGGDVIVEEREGGCCLCNH